MPPRLNQLVSMLAPGRLGGQTVFAFALKIWNAGASFLLSLLIARSFGAVGSGYFGIAVTTVTIMSYVVLAGLDYAVVRTVAGDLREGKHGEARGTLVAVARFVMIAAPLAATLVWLGRDWLTQYVMQQPYLGEIFAVMLWAVVPLTLQRVAASGLRATGRVLLSQLIDGPLGTTVAAVALGAVIWAGLSGSLLIPASLYVMGIGVGALTGLVLLYATTRRWPAAIPVALVPLLISGLPILISNLSNVFTEWYTTVSLGIYWPAAVVGQYRTAWQFVALAGMVQVAMDSMIGPRIAAAARVGAKDEIAGVARKSILLVLALSSPLFAVLLVFPEQLLHIFGPEFVGGAAALQILALGQMVRLVSGPLGTILIMTGSQRWILAYALAGVALCIVFAAILIPPYGVAGAALATSATVIVRNLAAGFIVQRVLRINIFRRPKPS